MVNLGDNQRYILNLLLNNSLIEPTVVDEAQDKADKKSIGIVDALIESKIISEEQVLKTLSEDLDIPFVQLSTVNIDPLALDKIPLDKAEEFHVMPISFEYDTLTIATSNPMDFISVDNLRLILNIPQLETVTATSDDIKNSIEMYYQGDVQTMQDNDSEDDDIEGTLMSYMDDGDRHIDEDDAPVIRLVSSIIMDAFRLRASDIHLEPMEKVLRIRYRIDGVLVEIKKHPKQLQAPIISRVKLLADLKLAEKRVPQDGKIKISIHKKPIDIRVSTLPGTYGESVVMRILDKSGLSLGLSTLGFLSDTEKIWNQLLNHTNGVILITGPTGSGKTTTLYSCLNALNTPKRKIITVEDPVEYQLTGINQVQVREEIGLTFSSVLRACLRQAPNIIMVGEIRDSETAKIAMNAAFTGHLVFSTLHTNNASGAVTRLFDQKIEPFLVASAIRGILAQRLVRIICPDCKTPYKASEEEAKILNIEDGSRPFIYKGQGCSTCGGSGYKGRCGVFELLVMTNDIQELVFNKRSSSEIEELSIQNGMRTLREDGILKVLNGTTTIEEILRVTKIGDA